MDSWDRIKEIVLGALELPPEERAAYLDAECGSDRAIRVEVESLLAEEGDTFLEKPLVDIEAATAGIGQATEPYVGPYRVVRPLGRGGMGEVLLAVQEGEDFERHVAIKLIRAGMATEDVVQRFRLERRILAGLQHPNLARLIDGGTTAAGQPYFVMEYVEGVSVTEYCDAHRLSVDARLELFLTICDAVHHAHQSLVVHRDIKPSNILVTPDGIPKLLDFGIGKVLDDPDASEQTGATRRVLTPEDAAPEQVRGSAITTATDVHGLGLLLYELLTGRNPFSSDSSTPAELESALLETVPRTPSIVVGLRSGAGAETDPSAGHVASLRGTIPSALRRRLRGDLDNIVLKALRKEPDRRYPSAEALRADVERHLQGLPVRARPDSFGYRTSKFVRRNPWGVAAAALAAVALGVSIVLPVRQSRQLALERDEALEVRSFLLEAFGTTGGDESIGARDLLDLQAARVDSLYGDRPSLHAEMLIVIADAYDRLGRYADAVPLATQALGILRTEHADDHPDVGTALNAIGWALHRSGESEEALPYLREAVDMRRRLGRAARRELARSLNDLGVVVSALGDGAAAADLHREALSIRRTVLGDTDRATGVSASNLAASLYTSGDLEGAIREGRRALELLRAAVGPDHQRTVIVQQNLAVFMIAGGVFEEVLDVNRDLLERQARLQGPEHPVTNRIRSNLGNNLYYLGQHAEAEDLLTEAIRIARAQGAAGLDQELTSTAFLIDVLVATGQPDRAMELLDEAIPKAERERSGRSIVTALYVHRANVLAELGEYDAAVEEQTRYIAMREPLFDPDHIALATYRVRLAEMLLLADRPEEADSVAAIVRAVADRSDPFDEGLLDRLEQVERAARR